MNMKEVASAMQDIEFILHSLKNQDSLRAGEIESAHEKSQKIITEFLQPTGVFDQLKGMD